MHRDRKQIKSLNKRDTHKHQRETRASFWGSARQGKQEVVSTESKERTGPPKGFQMLENRMPYSGPLQVQFLGSLLSQSIFLALHVQFSHFHQHPSAFWNVIQVSGLARSEHRGVLWPLSVTRSELSRNFGDSTMHSVSKKCEGYDRYEPEELNSPARVWH